MDISRIVRHLAMAPWRARRAFPRSTLTSIEQAIKSSEALHAGELRFVVEGALDTRALWRGQSARERAIDVFSLLRVWDTEHNSGVLIYVLLADRSVEIVADRGVHAKVGESEWSRICGAMEAAFAKAQFEEGAVQGVEGVSRCLAAHFPARHSPHRDELADTPVVI
jgi:uncharacterized membrane protein